MRNIEKQRYALQVKLDGQKTSQERNKLGQYSTPFELANKICVKLKYLVGDHIDSFLEPAIGTGVFYSALTQHVTVEKGVGYEIDPHYFLPSQQLWKSANINFINEDFLNAVPTDLFSLIVSNPPCSRHHHIPSESKKALIDKIKTLYGIEISGLAGLYIYFVILSCQWLKEGGISCWLIPSEFLSVNYGRAFKQFLLEKVELLSIHTFKAESVQFEDALVSSSIVIFKNKKPSSSPILFSWGEDYSKPSTEILIERDSLNSEIKWNEAMLNKKIEVCDSLNESLIGSYFNIKRGVATGDNKFFIVDENVIKKYSIPSKAISSVIPPPRKLKTNIYSSYQANQDNLYLITCDWTLSFIQKHYHGFYEYLKYGENIGVNKRANCKNREIWYKCEFRKIAPIPVSYMGRDNGTSVLRFILNEAHSTATNSYLMMYPKDEYLHLFRDKDFTKKVWSILSLIPKEILLAYGRSYGGGLLKWEPKELESIPCPELRPLFKPINASLFDDLK